MSELEYKVNRVINTDDWSDEYVAVHSKETFKESISIEIFCTALKLEQVVQHKDIKLVDDLTGKKRWSLHKLIQRSLDKERINDIHTNYLNKKDKDIKFFPSITIVLLPSDEGLPVNNYQDMESTGVDIRKLYESEHYVYGQPVIIKWNKKKISAVVVDGQHRVQAIRDYYRETGESVASESYLPVTFVYFPKDPSIDIIKSTRSLFVDINNTPRLVPEQRLIFIDDRSIYRRITSKVLGSLPPGSEDEDIYLSMDENYELSSSNHSEYINKLLIREKDVSEDKFNTTHKDLYPWEVTKLLTLHKTLIQNIVLQYQSKSKDFRKICSLLNSKSIDNFEKPLNEEANPLTQSCIRQYLIELESAGLNEYEREVYKKYFELRKQYINEYLENGSTDIEESNDEVIKSWSAEYLKRCSSDEMFEYNSDVVTELLKNVNIATLITNIIKSFSHLWFYRGIIEKFNSAEAPLKQVIYKVIVTGHEEYIDTKGDWDELLEKFEKNNTVAYLDQVREWILEINNTYYLDNNVLKSVVGQQMLFEYLFNIHLSDNSDSLKTIDSEMKFINELGENNFFDRTLKCNIKIENENEIELSPWEGLILKNESYKPSYSNAKKGACLIAMVINKITDRITASESSLLPLYTKVIKSYGDYYLSKTDNIEPLINDLISKNQVDLEKYLTTNKSNKIRSIEYTDIDDISGAEKSAIAEYVGSQMLKQFINQLS